MTTLLSADEIAIALQEPDRLVQPTAWVGHIPFAFWLVAAVKPNVYVELGVHSGNSYCAVCQEVKQLGLPSACFAVDTWRGDEQAGIYGEEVLTELRQYHDPRFGSFSRLVQSTFAQAVTYFADGSIDLLHIDGFHTYEAVRADFEEWRPKLSKRGVVLFHDINVREREFGVWKFWEELSRNHPSFGFLHSHGLGVVAMGDVPDGLARLFASTDAEIAEMRMFFGTAGGRLATLGSLRGEVQHLKRVVFQQGADLAALKDQRDQLAVRVVDDAELRSQFQHINSLLDALRNAMPSLDIDASLRSFLDERAAREILEAEHGAWRAEAAHREASLNQQLEEAEARRIGEVASAEARYRDDLEAATRRMEEAQAEIKALHAQDLTAAAREADDARAEAARLSRSLKKAERTIARLSRDCAVATERYGLLAARVGTDIKDAGGAQRPDSALTIDPDTLEPIAATELLIEGAEVGDNVDFSQGHMTTAGVLQVTVGDKGATSIQALDSAIRQAEGALVILRSVGGRIADGWLPAVLDIFERHPLTFGVNGLVLGRDGLVAWSGLDADTEGKVLLRDRGLPPEDDRAASATLLPALAPGLAVVARDLYLELGGLDAAMVNLTDALIDLSLRAREAGYSLRRASAARVTLERLPARLPDAFTASPLSKGLRAHFNLLAARRRPRLLIVYPTSLRSDNDAGSVDAYWCLRIFQSLGYDITFISMYQPEHAGRYTDELRAQGVDCPVAPRFTSAQSYIEKHGREFDVVLIYRVVVACFLVDLIRYNAPHCKILFHTVDLHFLREERQAALLRKPELLDQAAATKREELRCIESSDATIVVSTLESKMLDDLVPGARHYLVPIMHPAPGRLAPVDDRQGVLFVGGFSHPPNVDAVRYLCQDIWPLVRRERPQEKLFIVGADLNDEVRGFDDPQQGITVVGFVPDLAPFYKQARVNVAPLRFGAGIKGKVLAAMIVGLPTVATDIAAEGMGVTDNADLLIGRTAESFAAGIVSLCQDDALFERISDAGLTFSQANFSVDAQVPRMRRILCDLGLPH